MKTASWQIGMSFVKTAQSALRTTSDVHAVGLNGCNGREAVIGIELAIVAWSAEAAGRIKLRLPQLDDNDL
jgi:hypothetical protein